MEDIKKIIEGCLNNDRRQQFRLYNYCFDSMMSICMRYEKDQEMAMETLNQAFMKILKYLHTYDFNHSFNPWYKKITVNEAIDNYRRKRSRMRVFDEGAEDMEQAGDQHFIEDTQWVESEYMEHILTHLKEAERTVFNLYAIDGYSHKEIAELLSISERSSIRHLSSARMKLQEMWPANQIGIRKA